jgi:hypothetical protein
MCKISNNSIKIYALLNDEEYDWKGMKIYLHAGDTFYGGMICPYPGAKDYQVIRNHRRIWFPKDEVENNTSRFKQVFA